MVLIFRNFFSKPWWLAVLLLVSCTGNSYRDVEDCQNYDYADCNTSEPGKVALNITLTINQENQSVPLLIYEGNLEDDVLVRTDTVNTPDFVVMMPPDHYYTVVAGYLSHGTTVKAVDGDRVKKIRSQVCDSVCWDVQEGNVDVRLKY